MSGTIQFEVKDYSKKVKGNENFTSPTFLTSNGYKMNIGVSVNYENSTKYVSIFAYIVDSNYVNLPFVGNITFELLNQLERNNSYSRVLSITPEKADMDKGYSRFIRHTDLLIDRTSNTQYLMNDTLRFKVHTVLSTGNISFSERLLTYAANLVYFTILFYIFSFIKKYVITIIFIIIKFIIN